MITESEVPHPCYERNPNLQGPIKGRKTMLLQFAHWFLPPNSPSICMNKINPQLYRSWEPNSYSVQTLNCLLQFSLDIKPPLISISPWWQEEANIRVISVTCPFLNLLTIVGNIKCSRPCMRFQLRAQVSVLFHNFMTVNHPISLGFCSIFSETEISYHCHIQLTQGARLSEKYVWKHTANDRYGCYFCCY